MARTVVGERLAACANIVPSGTSVYWWEGAVQEGTEAYMFLKSHTDRQDALVNRIKALHSYACPCVVILPIERGNPDFLAWIERETASAP